MYIHTYIHRFCLINIFCSCSRLPRDYGSILYCTTGILLQKMQTNPLMLSINIIILDEIHERSVETDLLMALLKKVILNRS